VKRDAKTLRVLDTGVMEGRLNIAIGQAIVEAHQQGRVPDTLRFLRFPPTVLVGRHQALGQEINLEYCGENEIGVARRITGGGAIFETTFLLAGEIAGAENGLYMIYSQGNFIASSSQVPFLQIGEAKYGKPILDRVIKSDTPIERAALCGLVSMEATIRSNLTVGPPVEVCLLDAGTLQPGRYLMFDEDSSYLADLRNRWNQLMQESFDKLQPLVFQA